MTTHIMRGVNWTGQDVSGWWLSEKMDGFRCIWTGSEFRSREGRTFKAPAWFLAGMPSTPLDGELWAGRGRLADVHRAVHGKSQDWSGITFHPFDIPVQSIKIEDAIGRLACLNLPAHVQPVAQRKVESTEAAIAAMREIVAGGGEGAMVRRPGSGHNAMSSYRSGSLVKLKPAFFR